MFVMRHSLEEAMKKAKREQKQNAREEARRAAQLLRREAKKKMKPKMKVHSILGTLWDDSSKQLSQLDRSLEDQWLDLKHICTQINYLNDTVKSHTEHQLLTKLVWKIGNFKRLLRQQALEGGLVYSPKFSSHPGGYSLMCSLCCVERAGKEYISVMICLVRGQYDALLNWPFSIPIRISILAQNAHEKDWRQPSLDISKVLDSARVNEHTDALQRPTETFGKSVGFRYFVEKEKIISEPYLQNEVLFISIAMDREAVEAYKICDLELEKCADGTVKELGEVREVYPVVAYSGDKVQYWPSKNADGEVIPEEIDTPSDDSDEEEVEKVGPENIQLNERT